MGKTLKRTRAAPGDGSRVRAGMESPVRRQWNQQAPVTRAHTFSSQAWTRIFNPNRESNCAVQADARKNALFKNAERWRPAAYETSLDPECGVHDPSERAGVTAS